MKLSPPSNAARAAQSALRAISAPALAIPAPYLYRQGANAAGCPDAQMQSPFPHRTLRQLHTRTQPQGRKATNPFRGKDYTCRGFVIIATSSVPESSSQQRVDAFDWVRQGESYFPREFCFAAFSPVARRIAPVCHPPTLCFARRVEDFRQPKVGKPVNQSTSNIN